MRDILPLVGLHHGVLHRVLHGLPLQTRLCRWAPSCQGLWQEWRAPAPCMLNVKPCDICLKKQILIRISKMFLCPAEQRSLSLGCHRHAFRGGVQVGCAVLYKLISIMKLLFFVCLRKFHTESLHSEGAQCRYNTGANLCCSCLLRHDALLYAESTANEGSPGSSRVRLCIEKA